jgi:hypothetical protein
MPGLIAYRNMVPEATLTLSVGTAIAGFPLDNVKSRQLETAFRATASASSPQIIMDLAVGHRTRAPRVVALLNVSGTTPNGGQFSVDRSDNGIAWTTVSSYVAADVSPIEIPSHLILVLPKTTPAARYWRIRTTLIPNGITPDWYYQIGRVWLSGAIDLSAFLDIGKASGFTNGWSSSAVDTGLLDLSAGRQAHETPGVRCRRLVCAVGRMPTEIAYGLNEAGAVQSAFSTANFHDMLMHVGATGSVIAIPREHGQWPRRTAVYGPITRPLAIDHISGPHYKTACEFVEER